MSEQPPTSEPYVEKPVEVVASQFAIKKRGPGKRVSIWSVPVGTDAASVGADMITDTHPMGEDPSVVIVEDANGTMRPQIPVEATSDELALSKVGKLAMLESAFKIGQTRSVTAETQQWKGGEASAMAIYNAATLADHLDADVVQLYPHHATTSLTFGVDKAMEIAAAIGVRYQEDLALHKALEGDVMAATTVDQLAAITFPADWTGAS